MRSWTDESRFTVHTAQEELRRTRTGRRQGECGKTAPLHLLWQATTRSRKPDSPCPERPHLQRMRRTAARHRAEKNRRSGNITKSRIKPEELKRIHADITRMREDATGASTGSNVSSKSSAEGLKRETKPSPRAMPARRVVPAALPTVAGTTTTTAHRASIQRPRRTAKDVEHLCVPDRRRGRLLLRRQTDPADCRLHPVRPRQQRQEKALGLATEGER
jgi:hypothetical protein